MTEQPNPLGHQHAVTGVEHLVHDGTRWVPHDDMAERGINCLIRNHRYEIEKSRRIAAEHAGVHVWSNLSDPASAPLGTTVVFPDVQDEHHPRQIAVRWSPPGNLDEERPWLILGSDAGIQLLSNEVVEGCEVLTVPLVDACHEPQAEE